MAATDTIAPEVLGIRPKLQEIRELERTSGPVAAERALVEMLRAGETSHLAYMLLSRMLAKQQKHDDALRAAVKAKSLAPLESEPAILLGMLALRRKDFETAASAFADALRLEPESTRAIMGAAFLKFELEAHEEALALCAKVLEMDPSVDQAHELRARICLKLDRKDEAIDALRGLVIRNPENKKALRAFVKVMREENRGDEVLELLEADALADPGDRRKADRYARAAASVGRPEVAAEYYEKLAAGGSPRLTDKLRYAVALIQAEEFVKAKAMVSQIGQQKVLKPVASKLMGDIALKSGDPAGAVRHYGQACRAARVAALPAETEAAAENEMALAEAWRQHAQSQIETALRARRSGAVL